MQETLENELYCPISATWLEEPISVPCCGRSFSRESLTSCFGHNGKTCPMCRDDLDDYDPVSAPKNITIANMVEIAKEINNPNLNQDDALLNDITKTWEAKLYMLDRETGQIPVSQTIAKFELTCNSKKIMSGQKTLMILAVDRSGSMSGSPLRQVNFALENIFARTKNNDSIIPYILAYDHTCNHMPKYTPLQVGGGTSFGVVFDEIVSTCRTHVDKVDNVIVIFMTDGQDGNTTSQKTMMDNFKYYLGLAWQKPITIHTIGFGGNHDFNFLDNIRKLGTSEGAYRYADPNENDDALSSKINSITDEIIESSIVPVDLELDKVYKVEMKRQKIVQWIHQPIDKAIFHFGNQANIIDVEIVPTCDQNLWIEWYSQLTDDLIAETIQFNDEKNTLSNEDREIFGELLMQRARSIIKFLKIPVNYELKEDPQKVIDRLQNTIESIKQIIAGNNVDKLKLTDLKYEGKFATKQIKKSILTGSNARPSHVSLPPPQQQNISSCNTPFYFYRKNKGCGGGYQHQRLVQARTEQLYNFTPDELATTNDIGNTVLAYASSIGRCYSHLVEKNLDIVNDLNNYGETALDLAIVHGHWISVDILLNHGAQVTLDGQMLLMTCLQKYWYNTAQRLVDHGIAKVYNNMTDRFYESKVVNWILDHAIGNDEQSANLIADPKLLQMLTIEKGFAENMGKLEDLEKYEFKTYPEILKIPNTGHITIIQYLLDNNKADACEIFDHMSGEDITFPLFIACENGNTSLVEVLLPFCGHIVNKQTNKGTTSLWIACCNKHVDIAIMLLECGADPNICNMKGDSPLIGVAQKGFTMIAELLIEKGVALENKALTIACLCGQRQILELLLKEYTRKNRLEEVFNAYSPIDGFTPIMSCAEVGSTNCLELLHQYGDNLECRTNEDNVVIRYATPIHISCFYGKIKTVELLHQLGANINAQNFEGKTPLHIAIEHKHLEIVRYLLDKADDSIPDIMGKIPKYYATIKGNEEIYNEFYNNPLQNCLVKLIQTKYDKSRLKDILQKHGQSIGCYEHSDITKMMDSRGISLLTLAMLKNDKMMIEILEEIGIDYNRPDDSGLTPNFWRQMMSGEETTDLAIMHTRNVIKSEIQNKLLLNLNNTQTKNQTYEDLENLESDLETRMSFGYNGKVKNNIIEKLHSTKDNKHSLLGFIDKLNKVSSCNPNVISELLFDAKIHIFTKIANSSQNLLDNGKESTAIASVKPVNMLALYIFTMDDTICQYVNTRLEKLDVNDLMTPYIHCLYQSLYYLPIYPKECYRKIKGIFHCPIGTIMEWDAFSIATSKWGNLTLDKESTTFIIKGKSGRDISGYSRYPQNGEVVFLPGTKFRVTNYYVNNIIVFGQENIRETSFQATEVNIQKALEGKSGLIAELEEIE